MIWEINCCNTGDLEYVERNYTVLRFVPNRHALLVTHKQFPYSLLQYPYRFCHWLSWKETEFLSWLLEKQIIDWCYQESKMPYQIWLCMALWHRIKTRNDPEWIQRREWDRERFSIK